MVWGCISKKGGGGKLNRTRVRNSFLVIQITGQMKTTHSPYTKKKKR